MRFKTFRKYLQELTTGVPENGDLVPYYDVDYAQDAKTTDFEAFSDAALEVAVPLPPAGGGVGQILMIDTATPLVTEWVDPGGIGGPGTGANLTWDAGTSRVISDTGTDATLTAVDVTNPGLMTVAQKLKLDAIEAAADVTDATNVAAAGAVMQTTIAAKGDLYVGTANDTVGILTVGANRSVLVADSATASGLNYLVGVPTILELADAMEGRFGFYPKAGRTYSPGASSSTINPTLAQTNGEVKYLPFLPTRNCTITTAAFSVGTGGAAGAVLSIGIYDSLDGDPNNLVDSIDVPSESLGTKTGTFAAPVALEAGRLYFTATVGLTASVGNIRSLSGGGVLGGRHMETFATTSGTSYNICYFQTGASALPSTAAIAATGEQGRSAPRLLLTVGTVT